MDHAALYGFSDVAREILSRGYHDLLLETGQSDGVIASDGGQGGVIRADGEGLEMTSPATLTRRDPIAAALHNKNYKTAVTMLEKLESRQGKIRLLPKLISYVFVDCPYSEALKKLRAEPLRRKIQELITNEAKEEYGYKRAVSEMCMSVSTGLDSTAANM